jgi:hypothetical protein
MAVLDYGEPDLLRTTGILRNEWPSIPTLAHAATQSLTTEVDSNSNYADTSLSTIDSPSHIHSTIPPTSIARDSTRATTQSPTPVARDSTRKRSNTGTVYPPSPRKVTLLPSPARPRLPSTFGEYYMPVPPGSVAMFKDTKEFQMAVKDLLEGGTGQVGGSPETAQMKVMSGRIDTVKPWW